MAEPKKLSARGKRWYDAYQGLPEALDKLRSAEDPDRETLIEGVKEIITRKDPDFIERVCDTFPMSPYKRRWYDKDPYLWLVVNSLRYADQDTIREVVAFIDRN